MFGRDAFVKADTHSEPRTDINDAGEKVELFAVVIELHADDGAAGSRIESVNVTSGATDVTGACGEARPGIDLGNFDRKD